MCSNNSCIGCGNTCTDCCCPEPAQPSVNCPQGEQCDSIVSASCVQFDETIDCTPTPNLHPGVNQTLVPGDAPPRDRRLDDVIARLCTQFNYIFSTDFIGRILDIINQDETLSQKFTEIMCNHPCVPVEPCCGNSEILFVSTTKS